MSNLENLSKLIHKNFKDYIFLCFILAFHFVTTFFIYRTQVTIIEDNKYYDFAVNAEVDINELQRRLEHYADALYSFRGVFASHGFISKAEWDVHVDSFKLLERYPGVNALGYIHIVTNENKAEYLEKMNQTYGKYDQFKDGFKIFPDDSLDEMHVLTYRSPFDPTVEALGFNVHSEEVRAKAIDYSIEKRIPVSTAKLDFAYSIQGDSFLVFLPTQYNDKVTGELVLAFQVDDLIRDVYPKYYSSNIIGLEIYDKTDTSEESDSNLIFRGLDIGESDLEPIEFNFIFGERNWLVRLIPSTYYLPSVDEMAFANALFFILSISGATLAILFYQLILDRIKTSRIYLKSINS